MPNSLPALSARAEATTRRTYNRPLDDDGTRFETWEQTIQRAQYDHHLRLWENATSGTKGSIDIKELEELKQLGLERSALVAGRTLWLGGTEYATSRASSMFNCSALIVSTVYDLVDAFWLLLNGCGVGGKAKSGTLHGYYRRIKDFEVIPSTRDKNYRGYQKNICIPPTDENGYTWTIKIGDSAEAWAKSLGKMLVAPRHRVDKLVIDCSEIRGAGGRLKGYGWICNGYTPLAEALSAIHIILNNQAGNLLDEEDIGDIFNWCGTVLSSRRAAEILVMDEFHPRKWEFASRKHEYWKGNNQRRQSNNSLLFWRKPSKHELHDLLMMNLVGGEPGFINAALALQRMPWFELTNPCAEIGLPNAGFCNLVSLALPMFGKDFNKLERAIYIIARANYRQTCVNLEDGMLQKRWHQTNEALRLCGVSLTGIVQAPYLTDYQIRRMRNAAIHGAYSMADELSMPRPKAVTTIKPEGTRSKISGTFLREIAEGMHNPLGRFIFNWINFAKSDPFADALRDAGYITLPSPADPNNILVRFPIDYDGCKFSKVNGKQVNTESAVDQLERYKRWNSIYTDHNVSSTISFDESEVDATVDWLYTNWDNNYIATAFLRRTDPTKTAKDLGHPYLPQEVITEDMYREAMKPLKKIEWDRFHTGWHEIGDASDCATGVCPIK